MLDFLATQPPLRFGDLRAGFAFGPVEVTVTPAFVDEYVAITGDDLSIYHSAEAARTAGFDGPVMPPGLLGVLARATYLARRRMLPGGLMVAQSYALHEPILVGESLALSAYVTKHDAMDPKRRVDLRCLIEATTGPAATVTIVARWPPDEGEAGP